MRNTGMPPRPDSPEGVAASQPVVLTCPTCGRTNVRRITGASKVKRFALLGPLSIPRAFKSFECRDCKGRW